MPTGFTGIVDEALEAGLAEGADAGRTPQIVGVDPSAMLPRAAAIVLRDAHAALVAQWSDVTNCDDEKTGRWYLERHEWDLSAAVSARLASPAEDPPAEYVTLQVMCYASIHIRIRPYLLFLDFTVIQVLASR